jgi:uncharacterized protein (TIGR02145 family)
LANDGKCWLDKNLGATQVATGIADSAAYGYYYQWGRLTDGHQAIISNKTGTNSATNVPGHSNFIFEGDSPYDWRVPQNDSLWQGVAGINNPCPAGFRLPEQSEWANVVSAEGITDYTTAYSSNLKLPAAGYRHCANGFLEPLPDLRGYYWSSSLPGARAYNLYFTSTAVNPIDSGARANGFPVRCVKD